MSQIRNVREDKLMRDGAIALTNAVDNLVMPGRSFSLNFKSKNQRFDILLQLIKRSPECMDYLLDYHEFPPFTYDIKKVKGKTVVELIKFRPDLSDFEEEEVEE